MIKLKKGPRPNVLKKNQAAWTKDLKDAIARGSDDLSYRASKYNHVEIKDGLKVETHRKCAYCESKPLHVSHGHIEHIVPKSLEPDKAFEWENLTLACDVCNTNKGINTGLIDPYNDDPKNEFEFFGPMIFFKSGRTAAELTKIKLDLNRTDLLASRRDRIESLIEKIRRIEATPNAADRALLKQAAIEDETKDEKEYAACVRAFLGV